MIEEALETLAWSHTGLLAVRKLRLVMEVSFRQQGEIHMHQSSVCMCPVHFSAGYCYGGKMKGPNVHTSGSINCKVQSLSKRQRS